MRSGKVGGPFHLLFPISLTSSSLIEYNTEEGWWGLLTFIPYCLSVFCVCFVWFTNKRWVQLSILLLLMTQTSRERRWVGGHNTFVWGYHSKSVCGYVWVCVAVFVCVCVSVLWFLDEVLILSVWQQFCLFWTSLHSTSFSLAGLSGSFLISLSQRSAFWVYDFT